VEISVKAPIWLSPLSSSSITIVKNPRCKASIELSFTLTKMLLHIGDICDCWYLDQASTLALRDEIVAGDTKDWGIQARKVVRAACTHYANLFFLY
jgi:hypothetical protein